MNIGILTQPLRSNYGGLLQAYALLLTLRRMGHNPIVLNRRNEWPSLREYIYRIVSVLKCIFRIYIKNEKQWIITNPFNVEYCPVRKNSQASNSPTNDFIGKYISLTTQLHSSNALLRNVKRKKIDCLIVGSDQVWRQAYSPKITDYFLDFLCPRLHVKKIAYAASFGLEHTDISSDLLPICRRKIKEFDAVSIREHSATSILKNEFDCIGQQVLDPTMLLSSNDYDAIIGEEGIKRSNTGVVSYILDSTPEKDRIISHICTRTSCTEFRMQSSEGKNSGNGIIPTVETWLQAIRDAEFVVTDSFHGCVFSIIFRKPFVAIANTERGSDRFSTLLNDLALTNRLIFSFNEFVRKESDLFSPIDYDCVYRKYDMQKEQSLQWLRAKLM